MTNREIKERLLNVFEELVKENESLIKENKDLIEENENLKYLLDMISEENSGNTQSQQPEINKNHKEEKKDSKEIFLKWLNHLDYELVFYIILLQYEINEYKYNLNEIYQEATHFLYLGMDNLSDNEEFIRQNKLKKLQLARQSLMRDIKDREEKLQKLYTSLMQDEDEVIKQEFIYFLKNIDNVFINENGKYFYKK